MIKIAICDDDLNFVENFAKILTASFANAGQEINICKCSSGKDLIDKIEKDKSTFDIIFLDVEMPDLNGFDIAKRLRELNTSFLLIFTTYIEHQSREGYVHGAFRYVFKNNLVVEINEAVSAVIKKLDTLIVDHEEVTFKCRNSGVIEELIVKKGDILFLKREKTRRVI